MSGKLTPLLRQYLDIKAKYSDCLIFFRLGDFYELFFEDAEVSAIGPRKKRRGRGADIGNILKDLAGNGMILAD